MPPAEVTDSSAAHFAAGCPGAGTYVAHTLRGEVVLAPKVAGEFTGDELPEGWSVTACVEGGYGTLGDGMLTLHGTQLAHHALLPGARSLEIAAVFAARPDQHAGFGTNFVDPPWVMFSTKWGGHIYGRTNLLLVEDKKLPGHWFEEVHRFRIDWNVLDVVFSIDGERMAQILVPVPSYMRALAANQRLGNEPLQVEWMRLSPYARAGSFTSRVLDAGTAAAWHRVAWDAEVPAPTSLAVHVRTGDASVPDAGWTGWTPVPPSGELDGTTGRHLQYRADLATTDPAWTPVLHAVRATYSPAGASSRSSGSGSSLECQ